MKNYNRHIIDNNGNGLILCRICEIKKLSDDFPNHPQGKYGKDTRCKECRKDYLKKYNKEHSEEIKIKRVDYFKKYNEENADLIRMRKARYKKTLKARLANNLRTRIHHALKGLSKSKKTLDLLGCNVEYLKQHLQSKFTEGMNWKNYGKDMNGWQIDHIVPCASFNLIKESEQHKCFHYSNLQPLWAIDNMSKKDMIA